MASVGQHRAWASGYPKDPALQLGCLALRRRKWRVQVMSEGVATNCLFQPSCNCIGILLVGCSIPPGVAVPKNGWIDLGNDGFLVRNLPAVEGPDVDAVTQLRPEKPQPGNAGMGGLGHRALNVELKDTLGRRGPAFAKPKLRRIADALPLGSRGTVPPVPFANEIHVAIRLMCRPVPAEVLKERRPASQAIPTEVGLRQREAVVNAYQKAVASTDAVGQHVGDIPASPVLESTAHGRRIANRHGDLLVRRREDLQALERTVGGLRARVVDSNEVVEHHFGVCRFRESCEYWRAKNKEANAGAGPGRGAVRWRGPGGACAVQR